MDTAIHFREGTLFGPENRDTNEIFRSRGESQTTPPKRNGATKLPKELKWFACQAVRISIDGKQIERRSFPFFALSLEHARQELIGMKKAGHEMPFNEIWQYSCLNQEEKRFPKMKLEASKINIETGKRS